MGLSITSLAAQGFSAEIVTVMGSTIEVKAIPTMPPKIKGIMANPTTVISEERTYPHHQEQEIPDEGFLL